MQILSFGPNIYVTGKNQNIIGACHFLVPKIWFLVPKNWFFFRPKNWFESLNWNMHQLFLFAEKRFKK